MKKLIPQALLGAALLGALVSCRKAEPLSAEEEAARVRALDVQARDKAIAAYVSALGEAQKIAQLFLVNVEGNEEFVPVEKTGALYGKPDEGDALVPGGCLLFSYNIADTPQKIAAYTASIRRFYADNAIVPPYIAIDQEGGYVNRLRGITSNLVSQKKVTEWFSPERAHDLYAAQAKQMRLLGINMNLAPVVEVETAENADFLDTRSFGSLEQVLAYGTAVISAYEENGIATVLKHFPGNTNVDPHTGLPQVTLSARDVEQAVAPFTALSPLSSAVLMSHIVARVAGEDGADSSVARAETTAVPACFSPFWLSRARDGFDGLIFSDDIFMGALSDNGFPPEVAVVSAIEAGVHCIMLSEKLFGTVAGVLLSAYQVSLAASQNAPSSTAEATPTFAQKIDEAVCRVIAYKIKAGLLQFVPVLDENGAFDESHPAYTVRESDSVTAFDLSAFKAAYDEGMHFYQ